VVILERLTRWQAAPIHFLISLMIATLVVVSMLLVWYPRPYFHAAGGATLLVLLIGVDVIIGPLLTLIVFDPKKRTLRIDLAVIAALQLGALAYGSWIMFNARPVFVAFAGDRFELVAANEIDDEDLAQAAPAYRRLPLTGPKVVGAALPVIAEERERLGLAAMLGGSIGLFPQHYVPYAAVARTAVSRSLPLAKLRKKYPDHAQDIDAIVAATGKEDSGLRYLPLQARHGDMSVVVDAARGDVKGIVPVDPW
jgi:hypothetical protein